MKATVKKTVRWTVFREGVDASIIAYLCLTSEVGSSVRRKYVTHNHNKKKYISTSLFLYTTSNRVTGLEGDENDCCRWQMKGVRGRATTGSLRKCIYAQR